MLFWKRKKKFDEKEIEKIVEEYTGVLKETVGKYLPRRMRRMIQRKSKEWKDLPQKNKEKEIQEIKDTGLNNWLDKTTEETIQELTPFITNSSAMQEELRKTLKDFKKKWDIK